MYAFYTENGYAHVCNRKQTAVTGRIVNKISNDFEGGLIREVSGANYVPILVISF